MNQSGALTIKPRHDPPMQAMLVTAGNLDAVATWCGGTVIAGDGAPPEVELHDSNDPEYIAWAQPGEYVIQGVTGRYFTMCPELFERDYEVIQ